MIGLMSCYMIFPSNERMVSIDGGNRFFRRTLYPLRT